MFNSARCARVVVEWFLMQNKNSDGITGFSSIEISKNIHKYGCQAELIF